MQSRRVFSIKERTIAITGAGGYLGGKISSRLKELYPKIKLVGFDIKSNNEDHFDHFYQIDIRDNFSEKLIQHEVTDLIHLAWILHPTHNRKLAYSIDIEGTINVIKEASKANVRYLLHTSSTLAYGAYKDNPIPLTEESPLKGNKNFHYPYHKALAEKEIQKLLETSTETLPSIGIVRPSAILGPNLDNYITRVLSGGWRTLFLMPYPRGETVIQFTHIEDVLQGYLIMLEKRLKGIFNVTPNDFPNYGVSLKDIPGILKGRGLRIPAGILKILMKIQWFLRLSEAPPGYIDFVEHPFVATCDKFKKKGYNPQYSTLDALKSRIS